MCKIGNMYIISALLLSMIIYQIHVLDATSLKISNYTRTVRQTNVAKCEYPTIPYANIKVLEEKQSSRSILALNVACDTNYFLEPSSDNLITCINGFWNVDDMPECLGCKNTQGFSENSRTCQESQTYNDSFKECGQRFDKTHKPFIVNGVKSKFGEFPWHVGIYIKRPGNSQPAYECGGSIITEKHVLTAAHCLSDTNGKRLSPSYYYVAAGKLYSNYFSESRTAQKRIVDRIFLHHDYKALSGNYNSDIAVARVAKPFKFSTLVHPICIDWETRFENEQSVPEKYGEVAGWGATEKQTNTSVASELRVLKVPFIDYAKCREELPKSFIRFITYDKFCAGYLNGSSSCIGDSGGGLVFENHEKYYIRGLVSIGIRNNLTCNNYKYSVYTKISEYISFINESINFKENYGMFHISVPPNHNSSIPPFCKYLIFLLTVLHNNPTLDVIKLINASKCDEYIERKVCCGSDVNYLSALKNNPLTLFPIEHRNLILLPKQDICGSPSPLRQGDEQLLKILDNPWMALLEYGSPGQSAGFLCSGFLINERYVMTSAHCSLKRRSADAGQVFRVRLGDYDITYKYDCINLTSTTRFDTRNCNDPPLDVNVEEIIPHPLYDSKNKQNDIALLRLADVVFYTDFIIPICLPVNGEYSLPGRQMISVNWGINTLDVSNQVKRKTIVTALKCEECKKYDLESLQLCYSHICAIRNFIGNNECKEDTGGPLMAALANSKSIYAEGVVSFIPGACDEFPIVATRVAYFMEWILDNIRF